MKSEEERKDVYFFLCHCLFFCYNLEVENSRKSLDIPFGIGAQRIGKRTDRAQVSCMKENKTGVASSLRKGCSPIAKEVEGLKKIDLKIGLMEKQGILICPKCTSALEIDGRSLRCQKGHTYDISRKGTCNFVLGYGEENYNLAMLEARERVIQAGLFDGIIEETTASIYENLMEKGLTGPVNLLDAGCGDGSHLEMIGKRLWDKGVDVNLFGVDISKDGINIAGRKNNQALYFVADLSNLPFKEKSMDVIINILSPVNYKDFARVLKEDGRVYKVIPDTGYLMELRELYGMSEYHNDDIVNHLKENATVFGEKKILYHVNVEKYLDDLLLMTPMLWDRQLKDTGTELKEITVETELFSFGF